MVVQSRYQRPAFALERPRGIRVFDFLFLSVREIAWKIWNSSNSRDVY